MPEDPRGRVVGEPRAARGWAGPAAGPARGGAAAPARRGCSGVGIVLEEPQAGRARQGEDGGRGPLPQAAQVLAEAGLERTEGAALEPLDEAAHEADRVLEGEPRVALAPLRPTPAASRARRRSAAAPIRPGASVRRLAGRMRVQEGESQRRQDGRGPQVALDPVDDRGQADQLARRVEGEQLVDQVLGAVDRPGSARAGRRGPRRPRRRHASRTRSSSSSGAWRCSDAAALVAADRAAVVPGDRSRLGSLGAGLRGRVDRPEISSMTSVRAQVAQRVAYRSPSETFRLDSRRGDAAIPWNAASRWRTSGGRSTTSASTRVSGLDSREIARRCRSTAARATQPPRPKRSATTSPALEWSSIRDATRAGGGGGADRSNAGRENPGSWSEGEARPLIGRC